MGEPRVSVALNPEAVEAAIAAHRELCRVKHTSWFRLSDEEYEALFFAYASHPASGLVRRDEHEKAMREAIGNVDFWRDKTLEAEQELARFRGEVGAWLQGWLKSAPAVTSAAFADAFARRFPAERQEERND